MSRSKRLRVALVAALTGSALTGLLAVSGAGAQAPPVQFFGTITINGAVAPVAGTTVTASAASGEICATAVNGGAAPNVIDPGTGDLAGQTVYGVQIQTQGVADEDDCTFANGEMVTFSVNGVVATSVAFAGTPPLQRVDLAITSATATPTTEPTDTPEPTETGTGTPAPTGTGTPAPTGTATPRPPDTGLGGGDDSTNIGLIIGLAVAAAAALSTSGYVLARRNSR